MSSQVTKLYGCMSASATNSDDGNGTAIPDCMGTNASATDFGSMS